MDLYQLNWKIHELVDGLVRRLDPVQIDQIRDFVDHDEQGIAVDDLLGALLADRVPVYPGEKVQLGELCEYFGPVPGDFMSNVFNSEFVLGALDLVCDEQSALPSRGVPRVRGRHLSGSGRPGSTEFPADWEAARIEEAGAEVLAQGVDMIFANHRHWSVGQVADIRLGVVTTVADRIVSVLPLKSVGVLQNSAWWIDKQRPTLAEQFVHDIGFGCGRVLASLADKVSVDELAAYQDLQFAGELEELADALAAKLIVLDGVLEDELYRSARRMLCGFDLPVSGCEYINDRATVLARLRVA